ncbi:MAG: helix-turn-helix transcriptional regulator [Clostridia bacterium]|nr:helix-turn-helix transcriptional regulator [Clostridia bacterium]
MDQIKIGKFIAENRKKKNLTQTQLAEKLNITDRAVSKWETGKSMPDTSIMLELCQELEISVNELLIGEKIENNEYKEKTEELLIEMAKAEEKYNKKLLSSMYVIMVTSLIFYFITLLVTGAFVPEGPNQLIIILLSSIVFFITIFVALKYEAEAGYYECKNCKHRYVAEYSDVVWSMHMGTTRYLKCPECNKRSWSKKVMKK